MTTSRTKYFLDELLKSSKDSILGGSAKTSILIAALLMAPASFLVRNEQAKIYLPVIGALLGALVGGLFTRHPVQKDGDQ